MGRRVHERRGAVGEVAHLRATAGALGQGDRLREALLLGQHRRVLGRIGVGEVLPDADDLDRSLDLERAHVPHELVPPGAERPATTEPGVDLEVHPRGAAERARRGGDLVEHPRRRGRQVDVAGHRPADVAARHREPREQGRRHARVAQGEGLAELGHPEPGRSGRERRPGDRHQPVAVGVGLDDRHELGAPGPLAQHAHVVGDGGVVDLGPHGEPAGGVAGPGARALTGGRRRGHGRSVPAPLTRSGHGRAGHAPSGVCRGPPRAPAAGPRRRPGRR